MSPSKRISPTMKITFIFSGILIVVLAFYFILNAIVNKKIIAAIKQLPENVSLTYASLSTSILNSSIEIKEPVVIYHSLKNEKHQHQLSFKNISITGIHFLKFMTSKKLIIRSIDLDQGKIMLDQYLLDKQEEFKGPDAPFESLEIGELKLSETNASIHNNDMENMSLQGNLTIESIKIDSPNKSFNKNNFHFEAVRCVASAIKYAIPDTYESIHIKGLELDSRKSMLHIDTCKTIPALNKIKMGEKMGHQVDYIEGLSSGIDVENLDVMQLADKIFIADKINVRQNNFYAFRDRRLPLQTDEKLLPVDFFKTIPFKVRVKDISVGTTHFEYEEFPKKGNETGILKVLRMRISIAPFISHPVSGDPAFMNMKVEGSLMGSGTVTASMKFPLRKDSIYEVKGAFNELDLTTLNASAENLGRLHIESGMLNNLSFEFNMDKKKSTGKIVGEYHNLVIEKLREKSDEKKVDKFKSFFLKHLIIPKNKDKTLAESKRTGKVDYERDPSRYFSYYLLHSLLMGVKSSFSLGFLLPG